MQTFAVHMLNCDTGEYWVKLYDDTTPAQALAKFLRRKGVIEWMMSEEAFTFLVDVPERKYRAVRGPTHYFLRDL